MKHARVRLAVQLGLGLIFVGLGHYHVAYTREQYPLDGLVYYGLGVLCLVLAWRTARREPNAVWAALIDLWREAGHVAGELWRAAWNGARWALPFISMRVVVLSVLALNIVAALGVWAFPGVTWLWAIMWGLSIAALIVFVLPRAAARRPIGSAAISTTAASTDRVFVETISPAAARINPWGLAASIGLVLLGQLMIVTAARSTGGATLLAQAIDEALQLRLVGDGISIWLGVSALLGGAIGFGVITRRALLSVEPHYTIVQAGRANRRMTRWALIALGGLGLWLLALRAVAQGQSGIALWLIALAVLGLCWQQIDRARGVQLAVRIERREAMWLMAALAAMLVIFTFQLGNIPASIWGDEGAFFTTARDAARGAPLEVFGFGTYYQPALPTLVQSMALSVLGFTVTGWRLASVLALWLAALPLYFLARGTLGRRPAWLTMVFYAVSPYALTYARMGYDAAFAVLPVVLALALTWLAVRRDSRFYAFLSGGAAGLSFFVPAGARIALVLVLLWLAWWWISRRAGGRAIGRLTVAVLVGALLVAAPTVVYAATQAPEAFAAKQFESAFNNIFYARDFYPEDQLTAWQAPIVIGSQQVFYESSLYAALIVRGVIRTALAFHLPTLANEHYLAAALAEPLGVLYLLGLMWCLARFRRPHYALWPAWLLLGGFLTSALSAYPPRAALLLPIIPALAALSGLGLTALVDMMGAFIPGMTDRVKVYVLGGALVLLAFSGWRTYFVEVPQRFPPDVDNVVFWEAQNLPRGADIVLLRPDNYAADYVPWGLQQFDLGVNYHLAEKANLPQADWSGWCPTGVCRFVYTAVDRDWVEPYLSQVFGPAAPREIRSADGLPQVYVYEVDQ
jgi:4-amino-4-deoxy-L-arabinose transferase-like glycosyltransferase